MNWFLIALINPIAHALVNHLDKYLISRFTKGNSVGTLILFSALFSVVMLPILLVFNPGIITAVTLGQAVLLMINGGLLVVAILCYLYALEADEASYVAPLFQLIPVFGLAAGFILLKETLGLHQVLAGSLIVGGSLVLTLEFSGQRPRLKTKVLLLMAGSSLLYALNAAIFKLVATNGGFANSLFWDMTGKFIFGVALFAFVRSYRQQFIYLLKTNGKTVILLNVFNEVLATVGEVALVLAVLYAPVALVQSIGGLQPLFVFIIGAILTLFFPKIGKESFTPIAIVQKLFGIVVISAGLYFLNII